MENSSIEKPVNNQAIKEPLYKKYLFPIKILITILIFWLLAHHSQLKLNLIYTIFDNPFSTIIIIGLCYIMVIAHSWRWYRLNSAQGISLSFLQTITPTYLGIAFNNVLPGSVGGDFVRLYFVLKKISAQKSRAVLSILVDRIIGLMGIFIIASITAVYYLKMFRHNDALFYLLTACMGVSITGIIIFFMTVLLLSDKIALIDWLEKKFSHTYWLKPLMSLLKALHLYKNSKRIILESLLISMFTQLLLLIVVLMLSKMMGLPMLPLSNYLLALVIGQVANLIPLTPGGIGVGEAAFANIIFLLNPGITAAYATVYFALRLLSTFAYLPGVILGIFGFHLLHKDQLSNA